MQELLLEGSRVMEAGLWTLEDERWMTNMWKRKKRLTWRTGLQPLRPALLYRNLPQQVNDAYPQ